MKKEQSQTNDIIFLIRHIADKSSYTSQQGCATFFALIRLSLHKGYTVCFANLDQGREILS
jgi:hypothetical protein